MAGVHTTMLHYKLSLSAATASAIACCTAGSGALVNMLAGYTLLPQWGCSTICRHERVGRWQGEEQEQRAGEPAGQQASEQAAPPKNKPM